MLVLVSFPVLNKTKLSRETGWLAHGHFSNIENIKIKNGKAGVGSTEKYL